MPGELLELLLMPARRAGAVVGILAAIAYLWFFPDAPRQIAAALFAIPFFVGVVAGYTGRNKHSD